MIIHSSSLTPPRGTDCFFWFHALENTFPGIDVNLLTCTESKLPILDLATKIWRKSSVEIDLWVLLSCNIVRI